MLLDDVDTFRGIGVAERLIDHSGLLPSVARSPGGATSKNTRPLRSMPCSPACSPSVSRPTDLILRPIAVIRNTIRGSVSGGACGIGSRIISETTSAFRVFLIPQLPKYCGIGTSSRLRIDRVRETDRGGRRQYHHPPNAQRVPPLDAAASGDLIDDDVQVKKPFRLQSIEHGSCEFVGGL